MSAFLDSFSPPSKRGSFAMKCILTKRSELIRINPNLPAFYKVSLECGKHLKNVSETVSLPSKLKSLTIGILFSDEAKRIPKGGKALKYSRANNRGRRRSRLQFTRWTCITSTSESQESYLSLIKRGILQNVDWVTLLPYTRLTSRLVDRAIVAAEEGRL